MPENNDNSIWCDCENKEPVYYEFVEDDHWYHGWDCGNCGKLIQVG